VSERLVSKARAFVPDIASKMTQIFFIELPLKTDVFRPY
jgi:hypothetical protein